MTWPAFWDAVSSPRVLASYRLTFGASLAAATHKSLRVAAAPSVAGYFAGIAVGDTLLALQGQTLQDLPDFYRRLRALGPAGSRVTLTVQRQNETREVKLVTADRMGSLKARSSI